MTVHKKEVYHRYYMKNKERKNKYGMEQRLRKKEYLKEYARKRNFDNKMLVLRYYSDNNEPFCCCCGEKHFEFLAIDHINGGGNKHRKQLGLKSGGASFYRWLIKNHFPAGYRVLCVNCNFSLGAYGYCPHGNISMEKKEATDSLPLFEATA
jgi:hypothetical protein